MENFFAIEFAIQNSIIDLILIYLMVDGHLALWIGNLDVWNLMFFDIKVSILKGKKWVRKNEKKY